MRQVLGGRVEAGREALVYVLWREEPPGRFKHNPGTMFPFAGEYKGTGVVDEMLARLVKSGSQVYRTGDLVAEWVS